MNNQAVLLRNSLEILSSIKGRSWHSNAKLFQQLQGIGQVGARALFNAGIRSIETLRTTDDSRIEVLLKRNPPFGRTLKNVINDQFPKIDLDCSLERENNAARLNIRINPIVQKHFMNVHVHLLVISYKSESSGKIILYNQFPLSIIENSPLIRSLEVSTEENSFSCSLMYEDYSGLNQNICFDIQKSPEIRKTDEDCSSNEFDISLSDIENEECAQQSTNNTSKYSETIIKDVMIPPSPISTSGSHNTQSRCKHICKDKLLCAHLCCKAGQLKRQLSSPPSTSSPSSTHKHPQSPAKKPVSFLAGARRSLTNAREYLQKYQPINITNLSKSVKLIPVKKMNETEDLYDEIELVLR